MSAKFYENTSTKQPEYLANIYFNTLVFYTVKNLNDSCGYYLSKIKTLLPQLNDPTLESRYYTNMGMYLSGINQHDKAIEQIQQSLKIIDRYHLEYISSYPFNLRLLGVISYQKSQWEQAENYFKKAYTISVEQKRNDSKSAYLTNMYNLYSYKEDYKKALEVNLELHEINTKLNEERATKHLKESDLQLNVLRQVKELAQKNTERNLFIGAILFTLLLLGLSVFIFLRERRSKTKLTEQKQIIEQQAAELRQLDVAKTRFFANVSHELRTPLTLLLGPLSTMVKSNDLTNKNFTLASLARQHAQQLLGLVNEILDLTKLESGKMQVHEEATDAFNFLRRLVATFESYAAQKQIQLVFDFDADAPRGLMLDRSKVEKILNNLLSNALKFTARVGKITVQISHAPSNWQLTVTDTGRGIHPDDLPNVFNRFYQTNQKDTPIEGGTGIGLALAHELAHAMGGSLSVQSTLGEGARFVLVLPKKEVLGLPEEKTDDLDDVGFVGLDFGTLPTSDSANPTSNTPSVYKASNGQNGQKKEKPTILVVEDNPSLRQYLNVILSEQYHVLTAENGREGLNILATTPFPIESGFHSSTVSLVISDIMMPVMDGFQFLEHLKADEKHHSLPVIMLTARAEMQDRLKALRIGVDDYLTKPFEEEELFVRIKNLLTNAKVRQEMRQEILEVAETANSTSEIVENTPLSINAENVAWLADLEQKVRENVANYNLSADFIADELHISRAQFYRRLQLLAGLTPLQYIQEIRLNHARQLLEQRTIGSVKAVAAAIGFQKVQHFSTLFKERFGKLPSDYLT